MSQFGDAQDVLTADFHASLGAASAEQNMRFVAIRKANFVDFK
jgi:hypothetical protein